MEIKVLWHLSRKFALGSSSPHRLLADQLIQPVENHTHLKSSVTATVSGLPTSSGPQASQQTVSSRGRQEAIDASSAMERTL